MCVCVCVHVGVAARAQQEAVGLVLGREVVTAAAFAVLSLLPSHPPSAHP